MNENFVELPGNTGPSHQHAVPQAATRGLVATALIHPSGLNSIERVLQMILDVSLSLMSSRLRNQFYSC